MLGIAFNYPFKFFNLTLGFVTQIMNKPTIKRITPGPASFIWDFIPKTLAVQEVEPTMPLRHKTTPPIMAAKPKMSPNFP